jgi:predicted Zn-ribbon and HTH transcriptional regulator
MSVVPGPVGHTRSRSRDTLGSVRRPLRCAGCGYEIASYRTLPVCPMCRELDWEPAPWHPTTTAHRL